MSCKTQNKHVTREPGLFKEEFRCTEMLSLCSNTYCSYKVTSNEHKFGSKGLNKRVLKQSGDEPLANYRRALNETVNITSNNGGFRTYNHYPATYKEIRKSLSCFYQKPITKINRIHTQPLNL